MNDGDFFASPGKGRPGLIFFAVPEVHGALISPQGGHVPCFCTNGGLMSYRVLEGYVKFTEILNCSNLTASIYREQVQL